MKFLVAVLALALVAVNAEPPAEYGAPSSGYGAPSGGYGGGSSGGYGGGSSGGWGNDGGHSSGGHGGGGHGGGGGGGGHGGGGWGEGNSGGGGGWGSSSSGGFLAALRSLKPQFRYVNVRIPIPILPRIRLGLGAKINAHASIQRPAKGWEPEQPKGW